MMLYSTSWSGRDQTLWKWKSFMIGGKGF